jgi:hypothetical protein
MIDEKCRIQLCPCLNYMILSGFWCYWFRINLTFDQGHGVITTKDGSETANYTFIEVGNGTAYQGASAFWNIDDFDAKCERCGTINTITLEDGELKKQA